MTLRTLLSWLCGLCFCAGLTLRGPAAYAQAADTDPRPDANNPRASMQFATQIGVRIEPPAIPDQNSWSWHSLRGQLDAPATSLGAVIPQIVAQTRVYTPVAADEGAYLAVCYAATPDTLPRHCTPLIGPVKPPIPVSFPTSNRDRRLKWGEGSSLGLEGHDPLAVNDEIQIRGGGGRHRIVRNQHSGAWWQRSTSAHIPAQPADIETFIYLSHPDQWATPGIPALPAEQGQSDARRYLTADDVGRYVRGCFYRTWGAGSDKTPHWACTTWRGPVVATVHLPDEYRQVIVGVPSRVDVRGGASITWWRRSANDGSRTPTQVATSANPYTPAADDEGHYLRACHAVGNDRTCTRWLGPVLPPIPLAFGGDFPHVTFPGLDYFDRPNQRPTAYHVGDHLTAYIPPALQPIPLAPSGHASQPVWMVLMDGDDADHLQHPRHGHDRVLHVGTDFILPRQYQGQSFRICLYGAHGEANTRGWGCSRREIIQ